MIEQVTVGVDVGCHRHRIAIAAPDGKFVEEFDIPADSEGFKYFFGRLDFYRKSFDVPIVVAMEGHGGYARPLDSCVQGSGYTLLNVNNLKLCRFKEIFSSPAKTDAIDARKIALLARTQDVLSPSKEVLQEVRDVPEEHQVLKRLTRRRRQLVDEKVVVLNRMQADLQAVSPGLADMVEYKDGVAFLNLLTCRPNLQDLSRLDKKELLSIRGIGEAFAGRVIKWQKKAYFSREVAYVGPMIMEDARRIIEIKKSINELEEKIEDILKSSRLAETIGSIPGFGAVCTAELVAEIGTMERFSSERSLALYLGMAPLDKSSGKCQGTRTPTQINKRGKAAMMTAVAHNIRKVEESKKYYQKKRGEGKSHNQAVRALGRHMIRVIWSMAKRNEAYQIREGESKTCSDEACAAIPA
jgi:transposase